MRALAREDEGGAALQTQGRDVERKKERAALRSGSNSGIMTRPLLTGQQRQGRVVHGSNSEQGALA